MSTDPCSCEVRCPHGMACSGGHAYFPDSHWWPTCDECFRPSGEMFRLADGRMLMIVAGCRHALGPRSVGDVSRELVTHSRSCPDAIKPQRMTPRRAG